MPYRIDPFAIFIFLGIVQAIFLSFFFFSKEHRKVQANIFYGFMLVSMAACILEILLMYTGYIVHALHLVDFSEPFSLLIGPFFYFMVLSFVKGRVDKKAYWIHLTVPVIYTLMLIPFFLEPADVKYNCWIEAYKPGLQARDVPAGHDPRIFWLTDFHTELTLVSLIFYAMLGLVIVIREFRSRNESFFKPNNPVLKKLSAGIVQIVVIVLMIIVIKIFNKNDTGDHIFAAYIAVSIYMTSFGVIRESGFFKPASLQEPQKYKTSTLTGEQQQSLLKKLQQCMQENKPYIQPDFSLPELAQQLGTSVHMLSQVINDGLGKSFFEMTAEYRVEEAKRLLKEQRNVKVEEIAEQVGYNSKSSFNTAFKKITGKTPSEYRSA